MKSTISDKGQIDWKKIGHSKPGVMRIVYPAQSTAQAGNAAAEVNASKATALPKPISHVNHDTTIEKVQSKFTNHNENNVNNQEKKMTNTVGKVRTFVQKRNNEVASVQPLNSTAAKRDEDVYGGMELLETDFLLGVIENLQGDDQNDLAMRKISFNEMLRRDLRNNIDSQALKIYAVDGDGHYGKDIQCHAMQELAGRTAEN